MAGLTGESHAVLMRRAGSTRRRSLLPRAAWIVAAYLVGSSCAAAGEPARIAVFDLELVDTSLGGEMQGTDPRDEARLARVEAALRERLEASDRFELVEVGAAADGVTSRLRSCIPCVVRIARELGADLAAVGWVQKVSNLILNMNLVIHDVDSGERVFGAGVDLRGNTDESWRRALDSILERLLGESEAASP